MGDPNFAPQPGVVDIDHEPRVMDCRVDMGVDEFTATEPMPGDFDRSGTVDLDDLPLYVSALLNPSLADSCVGDMNGDQVLDGADLPLFAAALL